MNTINTPTATSGTVQRDEDYGLQTSGDTQWEAEGGHLPPDARIVDEPTGTTSTDTYGDTQGALDGDFRTDPASDSPFNQEPLAPPAPLGVPAAAGQYETQSVRDDDNTDIGDDEEDNDEVIHIVNNAGEDKPWELKFGEGISGFQKIRAMMNYPIHKFETEEKAQEVATMLRGIINADSVEQNGRVIAKEGDDGGEFFHTVSERGESPPGVDRDTR